MTNIYSSKGWLEIDAIPTFDLNKITENNDEYIDKSSDRVFQLFNNTWICIYPRPHKVVFDNISEFQRYFTPLIKDLNIKTVLKSIKNPQANNTVERLHQVILNMIVTKYLDNRVFDHIYPWSETLASIVWAIRASYRRTIMAPPGQVAFGRYMLFNLASVLDCKVLTAVNQRQLDIDNVRDNSRRVTHD